MIGTDKESINPDTNEQTAVEAFVDLATMGRPMSMPQDPGRLTVSRYM